MLIVGLGNPGRAYVKTRHNIGICFIQYLAERWNIPLSNAPRLNGQTGRGQYNETDVILFVSNKYMNDSGEAVLACRNYYRLETEDIIVVVDNVRCEFGERQWRAHGSALGHKGLKSVESELETDEFGRLLLGIGKGDSEDLTEHVLAPFTGEEEKQLPQLFENAATDLEKKLNSIRKENVKEKKRD